MNSLATTSDSLLAPGALPLDDWGVIRAEGADAAKFLHGQLTQDFELLGAQHARLAGYCSAKGRLLATLIAWKASPETLYLVLPKELLPSILKRLSMFVMRAKCKLTDASGDLRVWGLAGLAPELQDVGASLTQRWSRGETAAGACIIRLPDSAIAEHAEPRFLLIQNAEAPAPDLRPLAPDVWQWRSVQSGLAWVSLATSEAFVPQMINLELLDGVNFKKGCYPGQEVVARSQYRGTLKRRTQLFELPTPAQPPVPGQEIFHSDDPDQPAGLVANVAQRAGQSLLLAEVKIAALASGELRLGASDGPALLHRPLPYEIPLNSEV
ncbi:CAF17-like 4Fe-4S cluster assembly/insertion protein YgfZ [Roseateles koreensis]|uniref:Folate-binding protein n=1 Tax=Roseateles koreensis TaxID=2987526 RepID=A0ABT5KQV7_9BURK|nr:folate-binding protein [Roseateles koreensis]MDC8785295.1 folate-binding protein [Roseateles koreensis]